MKQAILITAYKDLNFIINIIEYFDADFDFFIHIDKNCNEDYSIFEKYKNVHAYSKFRIQWGGSNHCNAILYLIKLSALTYNYEYYHLITGSDYPIKKLSEFKCFFEMHKDDNFIEHYSLPHDDWGIDGGLRRIKYYWFGINTIDVRHGWWQLIRFFLRLQKKLNIERKFEYFDGNLWGGGTYWSLSSKAIENILLFTEKTPSYIKRFDFTSIAEEIFIHTILKNTHGLKLTNNYLRYINWGDDGTKPEVLTENDYEGIIQSDCFFARKFEKIKSDKLFEMLKDYNSKL